MLWKNCVLFVVFLHGVFGQDTNPEWLEPSTTSTTPPATTTLPTTTTVNVKTTTPNEPTERIPTTTYPTTTTKYPTRYPTTKYPTTRFPPTPSYTTKYPPTTPTPPPTPPTTKPSEETCTISLSKPVVQYYYVFGLTFKSLIQCCYLCCTTKFSYQPQCRKIAMEYCDLNAKKYYSYNGYDY